jgi:uncharacterized protein
MVSPCLPLCLCDSVVKNDLAVVQSCIMISQDLLDLIVCPACKKDLELKSDPEALKCTACRRVYPVRDGLPVLLIDEATIEPS